MDTGPLVALLNRRDRHHDWAVDLFSSLKPPLYTCEPVLAEACFLLQDVPGGADAVMALVERGIVVVAFSVSEEAEALRRLMKKYADVPMSLADACLVRMTEFERESQVITLDSDFRQYRRNRRQVVPVVMPK